MIYAKVRLAPLYFRLGRTRRNLQNCDDLLLVSRINPCHRLTGAQSKQCDAKNAQHRNTVMAGNVVGVNQLAVLYFR